MGTATASAVEAFVGAVFQAPRDAVQYGIKGMRWGVRRSDKELNAARKDGKKQPADEDAVNAVKTAQKINSAGSLNVVSSKELQQLVNRMNLEKQYVNLTTETPSQQKGKSFALKLIENERDSLLLRGQMGPVAKGIDALLTEGKGKHAKRKK